ncbi:MAG: helix-turn-helix domain-containing protein [Minicystis sp.]
MHAGVDPAHRPPELRPLSALLRARARARPDPERPAEDTLLLNTEHAVQQLALAAGYSDQPHLHRDFQAFVGLSPGRYRALAAPGSRHVPLPDQILPRPQAPTRAR